MASSVMEIFNSMAYGPAPEDASEAFRWLDRHNRRFGHFINGQWTSPGSNTSETRNPATGDLLATVAVGSPKDVDAAVKAAGQALPVWQALTGHGRARYLYALARQVQKHSRLLAVLETLDNGKPIRESRDIDVPLTARHFLYHAGWAQLLGALGDNGFTGDFAGHVPVGVVGQIIPWNFPLLMFAWKVAPALAAGCTVVLKPAEYTPLTAIFMAEIAAEIGLPPGVLNVVQGAGETGAALVAHPSFDKIAFTGSTEVGRQIRKATAATPKKLSLELGGKSPYIVFDDADLDSAVEGLVDGIWFNGGQVCCAGSRLLVQERIADRFYDKIKARMSALRVGSPLDKAIDLGAIADKVQHDRIGRYIALGVAEGATCWQPGLTLPDRGLFLQPTLLTDVAPASTVAQEEIFGPVLTAMTFRTPAEAVQLANNTAYGLAACIWSENINVALDVAAQVKAGVVWVNATNLFDAACGFGGYRESGFGREGGPEGMYEYLQPAWLQSARPSESTRTTETSAPGLASETWVSQAAEVTTPLPNPSEGREFSNTTSQTQTTLTAVDRTVKQYINGKQTRPDSGSSFPVHGLDGKLAGHAPLGSRKDIRNAVEAARGAAPRWAAQTAHNRAQILYFLAENLSQRRHEIITKLAAFVGESQAAVEFDTSIDRTFTYAAWADKFEGSVHSPPMRMVALAMHEPLGVLGILAPDEAPLLSLMSLLLPAIAMANTVVAIPSEKAAILIGELYQVCDTSDLPAGVLNLVAGRPPELARTLAEHDDVDALWSFRDQTTSTLAKAASTGNLKQIWTDDAHAIDWFDPAQAEGRWYLRHATQTKNIWVPYGE